MLPAETNPSCAYMMRPLQTSSATLKSFFVISRNPLTVTIVREKVSMMPGSSPQGTMISSGLKVRSAGRTISSSALKYEALPLPGRMGTLILTGEDAIRSGQSTVYRLIKA